MLICSAGSGPSSYIRAPTKAKNKGKKRGKRKKKKKNDTVDDQTDVITFCALTRRRIVSALWQVFLQKQLEVREGMDKVLAMWIRDVITHDLGRRATFIDVVAPGCARVLMSASSRLSHVLAVSSSFKHILYSSPAGAFTAYITRAPIGSVLPAGTVAQRFGRDLLVVVLHLLSSPSCRREVGASWTDVAVTLVAGIGGPAAEVAGLVARPLPLGEMARVVAQLGCDRGLHQHVRLRVQSVPVVGGVNVLVDTAM